MPVTGSLDTNKLIKGPVQIYLDVPLPADNAVLALASGGIPSSGTIAGLTVNGAKISFTYGESSEEADELLSSINRIITAETLSVEAELYQVPDDMELMAKLAPHGTYWVGDGQSGLRFGGLQTIPTVAKPSVLVVGPLLSTPGAFLAVQLFSAINTAGLAWDWTRRRSATIPVKLEGQSLPARSPGNQTGVIWRSF